MKKSCILVFLFAFLTLTCLAAPSMRLPLSFDYYYTYEMVNDALKALHEAYPHLTHLDLVGKSEEGRSIYCLTINNPKTGKELDKPGIYLDGNIHGNELQGTEVSLYLIQYLLTGCGSNREIADLVDKKCFYVVPIVNPDGRHHFFTDANDSDSGRSLRIPTDDDKDGLVDEDAYDDLDGDGNICQMRKHDPFGRFKTDAEDPRLMVPVKPGEKGEWTILGSEGIDNDRDGMVNEDEPGYVDANRNWGYDWMPDYVQPGAGEYPFSGVGLKALAGFIRQRPNICMAWAFHNFGGMFLRGPSTKAQPEYHPQDVAFYDYLGEQSERIVPDYKYMVLWKDLYETYGDFTEWMYMVNGVYGFVAELSVMKHESFKSLKEKKEQARTEGEEDAFSMFRQSPARERERLKFNDHLANGEMFVNWRPYKHPVYGAIEIGGWSKFSTRLPHRFMLKDLVHRLTSAIIFSAAQTPEVSLEVFDTAKLGDNLYRVRTRLVNAKAMPTMNQQARSAKLYPPDMLTLSGSGITVTAGGQLMDPYTDQVLYKEFRPELQFLSIPGFAKIEHQFLVTGKGKLTITYESKHAGRISRDIDLQ